MRPSSANSGETALEMLAAARNRGEPFRLLLLDINMPVMDGFNLAERIRGLPEYAECTIIVLTSSGMRGDSARCRELGIAAYLSKPVKQSSLLDAIMTVLGTVEPAGATPTLVTKHTLREALRPLHILLAEDNEVNRKITMNILEKRGHTVTSVVNGRDAVAALEARDERPFDLILMDVQMPEMDGLEATSIIRQREKTGGGRIPIIALTAHAMKGDRELCLNAGMDSYVSKPLRTDELFAAIRELLMEEMESAPEPSCPGETGGEVFNREQTLASVDGDLNLLKEVTGLFLEESSKMMAEIKSSIDEGDGRRLNRAAHLLKGLVGYFGARGASDLLLRLESLGKKEKFISARDAFEALEYEMVRLEKSIEEFARDSTNENTDS
jgi:CheY-like chemotaxis protein/HPt (histidine-containing phosphotransfer) domain-containing protein